MNAIKTTKKINTIYVIILFFSGLYYGEIRSELFDGADRLYQAIVFKNNYFAHNRFSTILNGILPWITAQFGASPKTILYAFVLNYSLTPFAFFLLFRYYFKDEYLVTFYLIGLTLFYTILFFHPNHDALFGYYYAILLYAYLRNTSSFQKNYTFIVFILCLLFAFTHQTLVPSVVLLLLYLKFYQKNDFPLIKVFSIFFATLALKILLFSNSYEVGIYSEMVDFKERISSILKSPLVKSFLESFYTINIVISFVILIITYTVYKAKKTELLFIVILQILFNLVFIAFFFQHYPYVFATEGYLKGTTLLLSIVFIDYFLVSTNYSYMLRNSVLAIIYTATIIIILLNGINYKNYFNNLSKMANELTQNTVYYSKDAQKIEQYFILHRQSALINLTKNNKPYYFQYINDSTEYYHNMMDRDINANKLSFGIAPKIVQPDSTTKRILDTQFDLIFDLTNLEKRLKYKSYIYNPENKP